LYICLTQKFWTEKLLLEFWLINNILYRIVGMFLIFLSGFKSYIWEIIIKSYDYKFSFVFNILRVTYKNRSIPAQVRRDTIRSTSSTTPKEKVLIYDILRRNNA
jgi:hypothetical protein